MVDEEIAPEKIPGTKRGKRSPKAKRSEHTAPEHPNELEESVREERGTLEGGAVPESGPDAPEVTDQLTGMVGREEFQEIVDDLLGLDRVTDDNDREVDFSGPAKEAFIKDVEDAYPVFGKALKSVYETGKFLYEVRERQKRNSLWTKYQEVIGQSPSFINNYIRVYEKFGERLPEFSHIGVSKLEVVARLKEPVAYIEANQEILRKASFKEVRKIVNAEKEKGVKVRSKRQAVYEDVGSFRLTLASNGRSLIVSNLNKEIQNELLAVLKAHLLQRK